MGQPNSLQKSSFSMPFYVYIVKIRIDIFSDKHKDIMSDSADESDVSEEFKVISPAKMSRNKLYFQNKKQVYIRKVLKE